MSAHKTGSSALPRIKITLELVGADARPLPPDVPLALGYATGLLVREAENPNALGIQARLLELGHAMAAAWPELNARLNGGEVATCARCQVPASEFAGIAGINLCYPCARFIGAQVDYPDALELLSDALPTLQTAERQGRSRREEAGRDPNAMQPLTELIARIEALVSACGVTP